MDLDEVMASAMGDEVSPQIVGDTYCGALEACHDVFDVRRASEWTAALTRWCESQQDLVPYRGPCMVYRVELKRIRCQWPDAIEEARQACEWLSAPASPEGAGDAYYQMAELHRLRGQYSEAEEAFRQTVRCGRRPEPGLPLLWLARGQAEAARTALRRCLDEAAGDRCLRATLLVAYAEVLFAVGEIAGARAVAAELAELARLLGAQFLDAAAETVEARIAIVESRHGEAIAPLRRAWMAWQRLDAPFEAARARQRPAQRAGAGPGRAGARRSRPALGPRLLVRHRATRLGLRAGGARTRARPPRGASYGLAPCSREQRLCR